VTSGSASNSISVSASGPATYINPPGIGINVATSLESAPNFSTSPTFSGTSSNMLLSTIYRG
jgi:hypothetical protein